MQITVGNLLDLTDKGAFDVLVQGCNTKGVMGSGIARDIVARYPQALIADRGSMCFPDRLGKITTAEAKNRFGDKFTIVNAYTQETYGRDVKRYADYDAIDSAFALIKEHFSGARIGFPKIGAGLARGDWGIISRIIETHLKDEDATLVVLPDDELAQNLFRVQY